MRIFPHTHEFAAVVVIDTVNDVEEVKSAPAVAPIVGVAESTNCSTRSSVASEAVFVSLFVAVTVFDVNPAVAGADAISAEPPELVALEFCRLFTVHVSPAVSE